MDNEVHGQNEEHGLNEEQMQARRSKFSEVNEHGHEHNEAVKAQKQMASQETAGVLEQE